MGQQKPVLGSHAEAFAVAREIPGCDEESIIADGKAKARAEGLLVISRAVDGASRRFAHKTNMKSLPKKVEDLYGLLEDAIKVQEWGHMRQNIDQVLAEEHPFIRENLAILKELEAKLNDNYITDDGTKISRLPPNHPLLEEIRIQKQALAEARSDVVRALDELIHHAGVEYADALKASRLLNSLWKAYKSGREQK